ncbi:type I-E CRISPR-associated protein Cas5/CasD [Gordonia sihwensis]|uniref:type I-E CRISPR-associated protein Cas5/CasD n=1 Tax=Gordonia sihwensis TaxID=173559 RepID=UPI000AC34C4D
MSDRAILMQFAAPTQSWDGQRAALRGDDALSTSVKRGRLASPPTATGIAGLLGAALGRPRTDGPRLFSPELADLRELDMLVRIDQPGRSRNEFRVTRRRSSTGRTVPQLLVETVLDDAVFLVGVAGPSRQLLDEIEYALTHPRYALYLGKREFPPCRPILIAGVDQSIDRAVREHEWIAGMPWRRRMEMSLTLRTYRPLPRRRDDGQFVREPDVLIHNPAGVERPRVDWLSAL